MFRKNPFYSTMTTLLFIGLFLLNVYLFESSVLGVMLLVVYLVLFGYDVGCVVHRETGVVRWWLGCWMLLSGLALVLSASYYIASITQTTVVAIVLLSIACVSWLRERHRLPHWFERVHDVWKAQRHTIAGSVWFAATLIILLLTYLLVSYATHPILEAVRSPWERLDESVLIAMGLVFLLLVTLLYRGRERALVVPLFCLALFVSISLCAFVFPIGFGFDSFIHKATEEHIAQFGTITPKPFYYIGQYSLVLFAHHGFQIPIDLADAFLLPVLAAVLLPFAWYSAAAHLSRQPRTSALALATIFLLPLSLFIVTTPQGLANLWTLLLILASIPYLLHQEHPRLAILTIGAFATLLIHPIAGIPTLFYLALLFTDPSRAPQRHERLARISTRILTIGACVILPIVFALNAFLAHQSLTIHWSALNPVELLQSVNFEIFLENRFNPWLDFVYLFEMNRVMIFIAIATLGWFAYRTFHQNLRPLTLLALALFVNYLLLKASIDFTFLIDYERQNYTDRLVPLALFFLVPFFLLGCMKLFESVRKKPVALRAFMIVLLSALMTSSFYLTHPRKDAYATNHGFNVAESDVQAVQRIEELAGDEPYLVLANQSVSAAAIQEIGFRYYDDLFFYPIPTGGLLYQFFLDMNERPSRETAEQALALVPMSGGAGSGSAGHGDVNTLFFVVNDYWWQSARIIETSKAIANDWRSLSDGAIHIFRFDLE